MYQGSKFGASDCFSYAKNPILYEQSFVYHGVNNNSAIFDLRVNEKKLV